MRLLVSVATPEEASAALTGGADVIDAKDPTFALGAVSSDVLRAIHAICARTRPVTAALGDVDDEAKVERAAAMMTDAGAMLVKVGFAGIVDRARVSALLAAAVSGARARSDGGVVAVAYADADRVGSLAPPGFAEVAARAGAVGVLLDTADKDGPGLRMLISLQALAEWVERAHDAGLLVALAGKLAAEDLAYVRDAGADIAGVRGAACEGGRTGRVSTERVRRLRTLCGAGAGLSGPAKAAHYVPPRSADSSASIWSAATIADVTREGSARGK
jgi:uncharacterized protein (UPF0264 family)